MLPAAASPWWPVWELSCRLQAHRLQHRPQRRPWHRPLRRLRRGPLAATLRLQHGHMTAHQDLARSKGLLLRPCCRCSPLTSMAKPEANLAPPT